MVSNPSVPVLHDSRGRSWSPWAKSAPRTLTLRHGEDQLPGPDDLHWVRELHFSCCFAFALHFQDLFVAEMMLELYDSHLNILSTTCQRPEKPNMFHAFGLLDSRQGIMNHGAGSLDLAMNVTLRLANLRLQDAQATKASRPSIPSRPPSRPRHVRVASPRVTSDRTWTRR